MIRLRYLFVYITMALSGILCCNAQPGVISNPIRDNWYVQLGLDMSLQCPYGKDFSQVFPKGKTFGIDIAAGHWFSPTIALRARLNWENGLKLFRNGHLEWLSMGENGKSNMDCGGYLVASLDVPVSLSNIITGYNPQRWWNGYIFGRAGIISNRATDSASPLIGGGFGGSYRLTPRFNLYGEFSAQTTTSEFYNGVSMTGMAVSKSFNCFFAFEVGVQYTFGSSTWKKVDKVK